MNIKSNKIASKREKMKKNVKKGLLAVALCNKSTRQLKADISKRNVNIAISLLLIIIMNCLMR